MPHEIKTKQEFQKLISGASEVRFLREGDSSKLKLRTKAGLITFKTSEEEAEQLVKGLKIPIVEIEARRTKS
jgi:hypothetical protein